MPNVARKFEELSLAVALSSMVYFFLLLAL